MNNSNNNHLNILDLPDEILFIILKELRTTDAFYSLVDVHQRFHRLVLDSLYIRHLNMTTIVNINSVYDQTSSINDIQNLPEICEKILPQIDHQVHKIIVEQDSMKQILCAANYPQVYSLSLINFHEQILYQYLTDDSVLPNFLNKQITHLNIDLKKPEGIYSITVANIFELILSLCKQLVVLNFGDMFTTRKCEVPVYYIRSSICMSSTLVKLKINVHYFADCLSLLDGRLEALSTLIINVYEIFENPPLDATISKKRLKLKCFSLTTFRYTACYDSLIVPLLCRMINLEDLQLYLMLIRYDSTYIDGIELYDQFLIHMTQLHKFTFDITSGVHNSNVENELPSNEDVRHSFIRRSYQQVASYVYPGWKAWQGKCRVYSLPYDFEYYFGIDNSFQRSMFYKVRQLRTSGDVIKYELFQHISHDFPFLEFFYIQCDRPIQNKSHSSTLITFPFLTFLDLKAAHVDFVELFLLKKNVHLPRLLNLSVEYASLINITNNYTKGPRHFNFGTVKSVDVCNSYVRPQNFHHYFPLL